MPGPHTRVLTSAYQPAIGSETLAFKVTVTTTATRLGDLIIAAGGTGIPLVLDHMYDATSAQGVQYRPPFHVFFEVPIAAANPVYMTWDNNTAPVVGGPGMELQQGVIYPFEDAGITQLRAKTSGIYQCSVKSSFQFIATASTDLLVWFSD